MTTYPWLKLWNEAPDDAKWLAVAEMAGSSRPVVWYTFSKALTHANQNDARGSIKGLLPQVVAAWCQVPVAEINRILQAFRELGILIGDKIAKWAKRQTEKLAKPRSAGAERQARLRAKQAAAAAQGSLDLGGTPVTPPLRDAQASLSSVTSPAEEEEDFNSEASASEREPAIAEVVQIKDHQKETKADRAPRRSRISADWQPGDRDYAFAHSRGYDGEWVREQAARFAAHHGSHATLSADWHQSWQTWVLRAADFAGCSRGTQSGGDRGGPGSIFAAFRQVRAMREAS